MRHRFFCVLAVLVLTTLTCFSQQREITQFSLIAGPSYLATPSLNLAQRGFNLDFATNYRPWVSMGFDFSAFTGGTTLLPKYLNAATQAKLGALPKPLFMSVAGGVPFTTSTYTYQMGPQLNYRHFRKVTLFVRPALGLLHAKFQTHPEKLSSPYATPVIMGLLNGKLSSADTSVFYGFGGGATWEIHPNFGLRATVDLARYNFFAQTLTGARNSVRFSVTTKFGFGRNIMSKY